LCICQCRFCVSKKLLRQYIILKTQKKERERFYPLAYMFREMDENDNLFYGDPIDPRQDLIGGTWMCFLSDLKESGNDLTYLGRK